MTTTREIIYAMLTSNTGSHMLDSGGAYGRHWERNASKSIYDFTSAEYFLDRAEKAYEYARERKIK